MEVTERLRKRERAFIKTPKVEDKAMWVWFFAMLGFL